MTKFNVGDRVRVVDSVYTDSALTTSGDIIANGSLGTVVETSSLYARVAVDGKEPWAPLFVDDEIELAPTLLNIGDRVRLSPKAAPDRRAALGDMLGTVREVHSHFYCVDWADGNHGWNGPEHNEVELAPALADDLRAKATAARAEADAEFNEYQTAQDAADAASGRMYTLRAKANALEAAAKILEEAE